MQNETASDLLARHGVDTERGFLPTEDPVRRLPEAYQAWEDLAVELPKVLSAGRVHEWIERLPELDIADLDRNELNRAMLLLSYLGHAYVFGGEEPRHRLPACVAKPWYETATKLGRPPVLSYASHALYNWRRLDPDGPIALGNIVRLENFRGGLDEDWFVLVHVAIEASAGPGICAAALAQDAAAAGDVAAVATHLDTVGQTLENMIAILRRMPEKCDPYVYYHRVRQFIFGWMDNPGLPDGVVYEGVTAYGDQGQKFRGETGAQSSIIPALDAVLGMDYSQDTLGAHLIQLRDYMPPSHRALIEEFGKRTSVRTFVLEHADDAALVAAYDRCIEGATEFRRQHMEYAGTYIRGQQQNSSANPVETGTGGTPFMRYLAQHVTDAHQYLVGTSAS
ncbi:hypothetical protein [Micromonospora sp. NPDC023814]|uniref:hypothetical protein n=1 Tax=Micromonospora sp. NPDC023814 TaxID=3154596 RepID=UPI00340D3004